MDEEKSEICEVLEEAAELLGRYQGPVPSTWGRNLSVLGLLLAVHCRSVEVESYGALVLEVESFLEAAFRMGVESQ